MKRRARIVAVLLVIGAGVNIVVCWAAALRVQSPAAIAAPAIASGTRWPELELRHPGPWYGLLDITSEEYRGVGAEMRVVSLRGMAMSGQFPPMSSLRYCLARTGLRAGWPCYAMESEVAVYVDGDWKEIPTQAIGRVEGVPDGAFRRGIRLYGTLWDVVVLPILPIWTGFTLNTAFWATATGVTVALAVAFRARLRLRRGLCPSCAYPIGSSPVCTECAKPVPARGKGAAT